VCKLGTVSCEIRKGTRSWPVLGLRHMACLWILKKIVKKSKYCSGEIRKERLRNKVARFPKYDDDDDNDDKDDDNYYCYFYYYYCFCCCCNNGGGGYNIDITFIIVSIIMELGLYSVCTQKCNIIFCYTC
jgi:hypothetical protein